MARPREITPAERRRVAKLGREGRTVREIAELTGISKSTVATILAEDPKTSTEPPLAPAPIAAAVASTPPAPPAPPAPPQAPKPPAPPAARPALASILAIEIDADADPLTIARGLLKRHVADMENLEAESPRLNQAKAEARQLTKLIEALEDKRAEQETPEQVERRRRRDDGDTRREMLQYVEQAEAEAARPREGAPHGICVTCGAPRLAPMEGSSP